PGGRHEAEARLVGCRPELRERRVDREIDERPGLPTENARVAASDHDADPRVRRDSDCEQLAELLRLRLDAPVRRRALLERAGRLGTGVRLARDPETEARDGQAK